MTSAPIRAGEPVPTGQPQQDASARLRQQDASATSAHPGTGRPPAEPGAPSTAGRIRLIASDLDGTLLTSGKAIAARARAAIQAALDAGIIVVVATGRQLGSLPPCVFDTNIDDILASNGAYAYRRSTQETLFADLLDGSTAAAVAAYLADHAPGVTFNAARNLGRTFICEQGYLDLMDDEDRTFERREHHTAALPEIVSEPTLKLIARHATLTPGDLLGILAASKLTGFHATTSGAPFLEIGPAGVTKATGLARLAALHGIEPGEVLALGDAGNDVEMLEWAGCGVAMADAAPEARAVAQLVTASSDADGFALVVEDVLAQLA